MAGAFVQMHIEDVDALDLLASVARHLDDLTPVMREIGEIVTESVQRNFEEHRAPDGTPWTPLAPSTVRQRAKKGRNATDILILNRILMGSIHPTSHKRSVDVGTNIIYAAVHQFGIGARSNIASRRTMPAIPARPYLGVREDDWPEIKDAVVNWITRGK